jgi:diaminopimelate epimerase
MHGVGNDFVVIDAINQTFSIPHLNIQLLAHRHIGIGFDQLLLIKTSTQADFYCQIFNSDGTEAEQCGNGLRCVARFIYDKGLTKHKTISIETKGGIFEAVILDDLNVQVNMGKPIFDAEKIPFQGELTNNTFPLEIKHDINTIPVTILSMGNPHAIMPVASIEYFPVSEVGSLVSTHSLFPNNANVGFMEIINRDHICLRTYERGVGETYACGSNACAAVVAGIMNNTLANKVKVELIFGNLWIEWAGKGEPVIMTGPAVHIFDGVVSTERSTITLES